MKTKKLFLSIATLSLLFVCSCRVNAPKAGYPETEVWIETIERSEELLGEFTLTEPKEFDVEEEGVEMADIPDEEGLIGNSNVKSQPYESNGKNIESKENPDYFNPDEFYEARLKVKDTIYADRNGEMVVWIGAKNFKPSTSKGYVYDSILIHSNRGQYVKITPIAPDFETTPEWSCAKMDPTGISEKFILKPKKGTYGKVNVSARIELFECEDCTGTPIPKTTETLTVSIEKVPIINMIYKLLDILWDHFEIFFGTLVALLFSIIIFKIKKKTGFDGK